MFGMRKEEMGWGNWMDGSGLGLQLHGILGWHIFGYGV
jgi:hypothetical protein